MWLKAGASLDMVKTLYRGICCIYLNRMHCEGSEVLTAMKVFAKADREPNRRFSSIHEQIDTVVGLKCLANYALVTCIK